MPLFARLNRRRRALASVSAVSVFSTAIAALAIVNPGFTAADVELNDSGIWVTRSDRGMVGRYNYEARTIDGALMTSAEGFDVLQQGDAVLVHARSAGTVSPVDVAGLQMPGTASLPTDGRLGLGGRTVGILDRSEGLLYVVPVDGVSSFSTETAEPVAEGLEDGEMTVGVDGTVHVVSPAAAQVTSVPTDASGRPLDPTTRDLPEMDPQARVAVTAVGTDPVVLDRDRGEVYLPTGTRAAVEGAEDVRLQDPGPSSIALVYATRTALVSQPIRGGAPAAVDAEGEADPSTPVVVRGCAYGAWAGTGQVVRDCPRDEDDVVQSLEVLPGGAELRYRTNRGAVVLNELTSGTVWLAQQDFRQLDTWDDVLPSETSDGDDLEDTSEQSRDPLQDRDLPNRPPVANDDEFGVRAGRTTILPILDNDTDPDGDVLTASLAGAAPGIGRLDVIYGGKGMQITVPPDASGTASFEYEANDGRAGGTDRATVRLTVRSENENGLPRMKDGRETVAVVEQQKSVDVDVLADWMDPDGDPLLLLGAEATTAGDEVRYRPDGVVTFQDAGTSQGRKAVRITVSDGRGEPVQGTLWVDVRPRGGLAPDALADHAVTVAGRAVVIEPLLNDIDPNGDVLRLARADEVAGATVTPDYTAGTITFLAENPGTYDFTYLVTDGEFTVLGLIRVDVLPSGGEDAPPVAVRDRALLPAGGSVLVDVLANDSDPSGGVLVVQAVQIPPQAGLSVAVLNHQILRITAQRTLTETVRLGYTVSNGLSSATGEVLVVPLPPLEGALQPPNANPDQVTVRVGNVVTIPVLANDAHPNGAPISLVRDLVEVSDPAAGLLFTTDDSVRFQAGDQAGTVYAVYEITDEAGNRDSAQITITIRALDAEHNAAPRPRNLTARVLAGTTTRIAVPLDGIDPDGDAVSLLGLHTAPGKGRIVAFGEGWLDYEANATSTGTDSFEYAVRDSLGAMATATVLVGIAPPAAVNQPPIALDDHVTARPGREVAVPVMANDVDPEGDILRLVDNAQSVDLEPRAVLDRLVVRTPLEPGTYTARYTIRDSFDAEATAVLTVVVAADAPPRAPLARDDLLTLSDVIGRTAVDVAVLENDDDPDGSTADLKVEVSAETARVIEGGKVRVTLTGAPQILPYVVRDVDDLTATAFIRVPGLGDLLPTLRAGLEPFEVTSGETLTVHLADVVVVAEGRQARVTEVERVRALHGTPTVVDEDTITFTSVADYYGVAALVFQVTDGETVDDPNGRTAVLTVPITVLPGANRPPQFTAPAIAVPAGEEVVTDLAPYATDPDPDDADRLRFSIAGTVPAGVSARLDGTSLVVSAGPDVAAGTEARLGLEVTDGTTDPVGVEATVTVTSSNAPLATVNDDVVDKADQGETATVDVLANDISPFPGQPLSLVDVTAETPGAGSARIDGQRVAVTPRADFVGTMVVRYRVADITGDAAREVDGRIRLTVQGRPAAPLTPTVQEVRSRTIVLTWAPPVNNGAPISGYTVSSPQGYSTQCSATTCTLDGLTNNVEYTFTVVATNEVGDSDPSPPSGPARPDERPNPPQAPTLTFGDGSLTVRWVNQAYPDRSPIESVNLEISPAPPSGQVSRRGVTGGEVVWDGLANGTAYQVRVQAVNRAPEPSDWGAFSASEVPAGVPAVPAAPTTSVLSPVGAQAQMGVSWAAPANNGDAISAYSLVVLRGGAPLRTIAVPGGQTSQAVTVDTSETNYTFTVAATNKAGTSAASPQSAPRRAVVPPGQLTGLSAAPLNNAIQLTFGPAAGNGATAAEIRYQYSVNGGGWTNLAADKRITSGVPNNGTYTASVRAVSTVDGAEYVGPSSAANAVAPYGPPGTPAVSATQGVTTVRVCWSPPARNGRDFRVETNIDNGGWQNRGTSGCLDVGNGYSQTHSISARTVDTEGQISPTASASARSQDPPPPPPPAPSGWVSKGGSAVGEPGCSSSACAFLVLNVRDFPAGSYTVKCHEGTSSSYATWWTQDSVNVPSSGEVQLACYYGYSGSTVSVEVLGRYWTPGFTW